MGQASTAGGDRLARLAVAVSFSLSASSAAFAADFKTVDGLIQVPNVVVTKAPPVAATIAAPQGGMRAYKDSADSELRGPSTEEMAEAARSTSALSRRATTADASRSSEDAGFALAAGGVGVTLDESTLQYAVVVRQADGSLAEVCVTGAEKADDIVKNQPALRTPAKKEILNVR